MVCICVRLYQSTAHGQLLSSLSQEEQLRRSSFFHRLRWQRTTGRDRYASKCALMPNGECVCDVYTMRGQRNVWCQGASFTGEPLTIDDFNVTSDDFDVGGYSEDILKKNATTWTFFAISLLFLFAFLLWSVHCCRHRSVTLSLGVS